MNRLRSALARLAGWWVALTPRERVLYRALPLLSVGWGLAWPPLFLIVPGTVFILIFFDFTFGRTR
jgi:hypothetical protein